MVDDAQDERVPLACASVTREVGRRADEPDGLVRLRVAVARELTKKFEECRTGAPEDIAAYYAAHPPKGEIVLLVGPPGEAAMPDEADTDALLRAALVTLKPSQAAAEVARATGHDRKALYARAMELK